MPLLWVLTFGTLLPLEQIAPTILGLFLGTIGRMVMACQTLLLLETQGLG